MTPIVPTTVVPQITRSSLKQSWSTHIEAIKHRRKTDLAALKTRLKTEMTEFKASEKKQRRAFFEQNPKGADRRVYMKGFLDRLALLEKAQKDARRARDDYWSKEMEAADGARKQALDAAELLLKSGQSATAELLPPVIGQ